MFAEELNKKRNRLNKQNFLILRLNLLDKVFKVLRVPL